MSKPNVRINIRMEPALVEFLNKMSNSLCINRNQLINLVLYQFKEEYSDIEVSKKSLVNCIEKLVHENRE